MHAIQLPRLGQTMDEALLTTWMVQVGQAISVGDELYEIETEKVTTTIESNLTGSIVRILVANDSIVPVGEVLAVLAEPGEKPSEAEIDTFVGQPASAAPFSRTDEQPKAQTPPAVTSTDVSAGIPETSGRTRAMPRTRALARSLGLAIENITAGPSGLVTEDDVRGAAGKRPNNVESTADVLEIRRLNSIQRAMADNVSRSWSNVPQFTQTIDVDVTDWRKRSRWVSAATDAAVTFTDLVVDSVVRAALSAPEANSTFEGQHLRIYRDVNVALAVDTPEGLVVPVLRGLRDLSASARADVRRNVTARARSGELTLDDVTGGTITVSNLGATRVQGGIPLLVEPYSAIVFIGTTRKQPVVIGEGLNEGIAIRDVCTVAITYDHRALDGATAARFTTAVAEAMGGDFDD